MIASINPANGETLKTFEEMDEAAIEDALGNANAVFPAFSKRSKLKERLECLSKLATLLREEKESLAKIMTLEMGKPVLQSEAEIDKCAVCCEYYVKNTERILENTVIKTENSKSYVRWLPMGPILAVMPWNFPIWQVIRFAAPALAAGNVVLLKHASNVPQCALRIEELCLKAGFPVGTFKTLLIGSSKVKAIIQDERVKGVTLTGSEPAGRAVAATAGNEIKPAVLELGGADPFIVMPSAKIEKAVATALKARTMNNGQSCIAAKRFIVHSKVYNAFIDQLSSALHEMKIGNPLHRDVEIGPLATTDIRDELAEQVAATVDAGATIVFEGSVPEGEGAWFPPTILTHIPENSPGYSEEFFGPVACVFKVESIDEAIELANATRFGLGSAAWTNDEGEQVRFIDELEAGFTAINGMTTSDPRLPFGGVKASGIGRELADLGMKAFLNAKTVTIN
ncbi:MAG: NADP-dependent succinic semialdehyde dehydrogenase [Ponticaulis sp.]|nr:NADP-dependent succinic semialdehyde dehydrogenase [Ponticaulis sp.]